MKTDFPLLLRRSEIILASEVSKRRNDLKTIRFCVIALFAIAGVFPVIAQDSAGSGATKGENWSSYYYVNVPLEKVYPHRLGYVISYRKGGAELGTAYLPMKWFEEAGGKGDLVNLDAGANWPYLTVYYKDGAFSHVRLFVRKNLNHLSWGNIPQGAQIDEKFDLEDLKLEY